MQNTGCRIQTGYSGKVYWIQNTGWYFGREYRIQDTDWIFWYRKPTEYFVTGYTLQDTGYRPGILVQDTGYRIGYMIHFTDWVFW